MPEIFTRPESHRRPILQGALTVLVALLVTYAAYRGTAAAVAHQPLYELRWDTPTYTRNVNALGPWLIVDEYRKPGNRDVHVEFRSLADGSLVSQRSVPVDGFVRHFTTVIDDPELGKECLVGYNNPQNKIAIFQPRTGAPKTIAEFPGGITFQFSFSPDQRRWVEQRHLPLAPFALLGTNGFADVLAADFQTLLGHESHHYGYLSVPLIRIRDVATGKVVGEFSLPAHPGCFPRVTHLAGTQHLLEMQHPAAPNLTKLLPQPRPRPEGENSLRPLFAGFRIRDPATGQVRWEHPGPDWFTVLGTAGGACVLIKHEDAETDWLNWDDSTRSQPKMSYHLLLPDERRLIPLVKPVNGSHYIIAGENSFRLVSWDVEPDPAVPRSENRFIKTTISWTEYNRTGIPLCRREYVAPGNGFGNVIPGCDQIILGRHHEWPGQDRLNDWAERWRVLRWLPLQTAHEMSITDVVTGQTHLTQSGRPPIYVSTDATRDGRHLLVTRTHHDQGPTSTRLSVYGLPFPPLTWSQQWLPALATSATASLCIALVIWRFRRARRKAA